MDFKLKKKSSNFILNSNNDIAILNFLKLIDFHESDLAMQLVSKVLKTQLADGSFPSDYDSENGGIKNTCRITHLLLDYDYLPDNVIISSAIDFLLSKQNPDGGWSENPDVTIPENTMELSTVNSITWLSADIIDLLHRVGTEKIDSYKKALLWLIEMQNEEGGWTMWKKEKHGSDPDSTAQILFMLKEYCNKECFLWQKGFSLFEKFLNEREEEAKQGYYIETITQKKKRNDIYTLSHLLLSSLTDKERRIKSGYNMKDPRVRNIVEEIINIQNLDGGWNPFWQNESDPIYTVLAVKLLILLDLIDKDEIRNYVQSIIE